MKPILIFTITLFTFFFTFAQEKESLKIDALLDSNKKEIIYRCFPSNVSKDTDPLVILNDKEIDYSDIKNLDKQTIESLNVLKGNAATAIYGARALNGVIVITLKKEEITQTN